MKLNLAALIDIEERWGELCDAIVGLDRVTGAMPEIRALMKVAEEAKQVAEIIICRCEPCWTDRRMHAPACEAIEVDGLREALAELSVLQTSKENGQ